MHVPPQHMPTQHIQIHLLRPYRSLAPTCNLKHCLPRAYMLLTEQHFCCCTHHHCLPCALLLRHSHSTNTEKGTPQHAAAAGRAPRNHKRCKLSRPSKVPPRLSYDVMACLSTHDRPTPHCCCCCHPCLITPQQHFAPSVSACPT